MTESGEASLIEAERARAFPPGTSYSDHVQSLVRRFKNRKELKAVVGEMVNGLPPNTVADVRAQITSYEKEALPEPGFWDAPGEEVFDDILGHCRRIFRIARTEPSEAALLNMARVFTHIHAITVLRGGPAGWMLRRIARIKR